MTDKLYCLLETAVKESLFYKQECERYANIQEFYSSYKLHKKDIVENMYDIISKKIDGNLYKTMQVNTTSGTSGVPLKTLWHPDDLMRSNLSIWRLRKKFHNILPSDCHCSLHTVSYLGERINKIEKTIISQNSISFCKLCQDEESMCEYYNVMRIYKPTWLLFQPSFAINFVEFCLRKKLPPISSVKYIEFTGELLTSAIRSRVASFFDCETANMYGCMEVNSIAYECPCGNMHVLEDNVAIEVDSEKNIFVTSLNNFAFPLIKYEVGDKVDGISVCECPCGIKGTTIASILGRASKEIVLKNGQHLNEAMLAYAVERAEAVIGIRLKTYSAIYDKEQLIIRIICESNSVQWKSLFCDSVLKTVYELCGLSNISFEFSEELNTWSKLGKSGKYSILEVKE